MSYPQKKLIKDIDPNEVQKFKESFDNNITKILSEGDEGYEESILRWADKSIRKAGIVVQATCLNDIVKTVNFANKNNLDFAVCCGGHSTSGSSSSEGGIVLNMRKLNKVRVDTEKKLIYAQGGSLFGEVDSEAGLATVGDGEVRELSANKNEDLFWAIRGCGINFGVVYEFIFKAHEQKEVFAGFLSFPGEKLDSAVEASKAWLKNRGTDENITFIINRLPPENKPAITFILFSDDPSEQVFRKKFSIIYECGEPIFEKVERMPYPKLNMLLGEIPDFGGRKAVLNAQVDYINISSVREAYDSFVNFTNENPETAQTHIEIDLIDSKKIASVPSDSTAFHPRKQFYHVVIVQRWKTKQCDKIIYNWSKSIQSIFNKDGDKSLYINFMETTTDQVYNNEEMLKNAWGKL
ncbi:hypothetical protein C1646_739857 [Rhizophagus diaphanus]|nr:hypothetical protein C1646_739857 [Rhizophagus diaphanus] [Rhizophagus sp. MUCL 43196]